MEEKKQAEGLGDTLKQVFDKTGITTVVEKVVEVLDLDECGCKTRQESLNKMFPYNKEK